MRAQDAAARDHRAARHPGRGAEGVERRAPGDERGAALVDRGARDQQGGAAVGQRGADDRQPGAEDQDRGADPGQQRHPEPDQLDRHRHHLPRPVGAHQAVHAAHARHLQPDPGATAAGRSPTSPRCSSTQDLPADVERVLERLERVEREVRDARRPLAPDARPAVPHRRGPHRRRGADVRRHHRAAPDRGAAARLGGAAQRHRRAVRRRHCQSVELDGTFTFVNAKLASLLGYAPRVADRARR